MAQEKWLIQPGESHTIDVELVRALKVGFIGGQIDIVGHDEPGARIEVHSVTGRDLKIVDRRRPPRDRPPAAALGQLHRGLQVDALQRHGRRQRARPARCRAQVRRRLGDRARLRARTPTPSQHGLRGCGGRRPHRRHRAQLRQRRTLGPRPHRPHRRAHGLGRRDRHRRHPPVHRPTASRPTSWSTSSGTPDEIAINTVSGDTTIRIPEAVGARYRVNTVSGKVQLDNMTVVGGMRQGLHGHRRAPSTERGSRSASTPSRATLRAPQLARPERRPERGRRRAASRRRRHDPRLRPRQPAPLPAEPARRVARGTATS